MSQAKRIVLAARPKGEPKPSDFRLEEFAVPTPGAGEVLLRTIEEAQRTLEAVAGEERWEEATARGAAYLAALAVGYYKSTDEISSQWGWDRKFEPKIGQDERMKLRDGWSKALARAKAWAT